jgi:hypothetical protein
MQFHVIYFYIVIFLLNKQKVNKVLAVFCNYRHFNILYDKHNFVH